MYQHAQQQYSELVDSLFSATVSVKNRFEDYRCAHCGREMGRMHFVFNQWNNVCL